MHFSSVVSDSFFITASLAQTQGPWGQCGGNGYTGPSVCVSNYICIAVNAWYSQCQPQGTIPATTLITTASTTAAPSPTATNGSGNTCRARQQTTKTGKVKLGGVNIAGFDFGCSTDGTCIASGTTGPYPPLGPTYNLPDGPGQMSHFISKGFNTFRLPVGWQFLTQNQLGGNLDATSFARYDILVRDCLNKGAYCIIDIHNYARWNGGIVGQGGPSNAQFAALWASLASSYKDDDKIIFGVVNEPHDIPNISLWADTVQEVVRAIRNAGALKQMILMPGNNWASAGDFLASGSAGALSKITNPDGTITNLVFDLHKYLDVDNSGTHSECVTNNIDNAFRPVADWLRCHNRQAFLTETGGGNTDSCVSFLNQELMFLNNNSDVYVGYLGWAAGSFDANYILSLTPKSDGSDQRLIAEAFLPNFAG